MGLIPYRRNDWASNPFRELESIQKEINKLFDFSLIGSPFAESTLLCEQWSPAIDVSDSKDNFLVKVDLPGLTKDKIEISVQGNNLIIKGEKKKDSEIKAENYYKTERYYGGFYRTLQMPAEIDEEKVDAKYQEGVLSITLPKKKDAKTKQFRVNVK